MERSAEISSCRQFRYALERKWAEGSRVLFIMLNPSTADETEDDRTIGRCISFAKSWGFGSLAVGNLFAYRTSSPTLLMEAANPIGDENDRWLQKSQESADLTLAAWGNNGKFGNRGSIVARLLIKPHMLRLTKLGQPSHPLYIRSDTQPIPWNV